MDRAEFDRYADEYQLHHAQNIRVSGESPSFFAKYKVDDVATVLRGLGREPARILDFGGGIGNSLGFMLEAFPHSEIVLLDPSSKSLDVARRRYPGRASFQTFDGGAIPYPEKSFDLVFAACVFHHIPPEMHIALLMEIERVLRPRGSLFVFEHNPYNPVTARVIRECPFDQNAVLVTPTRMRRNLCAAGFEPSRIVYRIFFPHFLRCLRGMERYLGRLPLGAQYYAHSFKGS